MSQLEEKGLTSGELLMYATLRQFGKTGVYKGILDRASHKTAKRRKVPNSMYSHFKQHAEALAWTLHGVLWQQLPFFHTRSHISGTFIDDCCT